MSDALVMSELCSIIKVQSTVTLSNGEGFNTPSLPSSQVWAFLWDQTPTGAFLLQQILALKIADVDCSRGKQFTLQ